MLIKLKEMFGKRSEEELKGCHQAQIVVMYTNILLGSKMQRVAKLNSDTPHILSP